MSDTIDRLLEFAQIAQRFEGTDEADFARVQSLHAELSLLVTETQRAALDAMLRDAMEVRRAAAAASERLLRTLQRAQQQRQRAQQLLQRWQQT